MLKDRSTRIFLLLAAILFLSPGLWAQSATILGTVSDNQGARVPDTRITITDVQTGVSTSTTSDSQGIYSVPSLSIGRYSVKAQHDGFKVSEKGPITLTVGMQAVIDFSMTVGAASETVNVVGGAPVVDTTDSSIGWLVGGKQMQDLPLNGRNFIQLTLLNPGVQPVPQENTEGASTMVPFGFGSPQRFSVAGGRPQGQLFLLDGTNTAGVWGNGTGVNLAGTTLGVDAIAEFQMLTDTYSANYGGNGGVVNAVIRAGTNRLHGSAYEFARNSAMDARNYFDPTSGPLPFSRNQFGGTIGGPIRRNSTFYFFNYEQLEQALTVPNITYVPDANFRNGYLPCSQAFAVPCNPSTGLADVGVNPNIQSYLNSFPAPNGPSLGNGTAEAIVALSQPVSEHYGVVRIDQTLSASDALTGSYNIDDGEITSYPNPTVKDQDAQRNQTLGIEERKVISPRLLNVAHLSYVRSNIVVASNYNPALTIVPNAGYNGTFDITGLSAIGGEDDTHEVLNRYTLQDQVSLVKGRHAIDFGMAVARDQIDADIPIINGGTVLYVPLGPFSAFQNFLENTPFLFAGVPLTANNSSRALRYTTLAPYIQDQFQMTPRFTINIGLRYDFETNPTEVHDNLYTLVNPLTATGFTRVPRAFAHNITRRNLEPRFGFAWDPQGDHRTAIRGGFGLFDDLPLDMQIAISYLFNPPIYNVTEILLPTIPNPFGGGGTSIPGLPGSAQLTDYNSKMNDYIMQYNLMFEHQVARDTTVTLGYIGSRANHLFIGQETNPCKPTSVLPDGTIVRNYANTATCPVPNPALSSVVDRFPVGTSNYNSLQASLDRTMGKIAEFRTAYTFSKCMDFGSYYTGNDSIGPNGQTFGLQAGSLANTKYNVDYGPCDYDLRNNWTSNLILALPFQGNRFKTGWQFTAIGSVHSGTPFSPFDAIDQANVGAGGAADNAERPDIVLGRSSNPTGLRTTAAGPYWYDPTAFRLQPAGVFGNLSRNTITAPGVRELDLGVMKNTQLSGNLNLQLRAEAFNITNHTNFGFPSAALYEGVNPDGTGVANPAAGQLTTTATTSRQIQLSARVSF